MLSLNRKTDYALVALTGLAETAPTAASAHELADRYRLPLPALRNILKVLAQRGVVSSTKGSAGGYRLAKAAEDITLAEVVQAVQGPVRLAMCCPADGQDHEHNHPCRLEDGCRIKATVRHVNRRLMDFLHEVNLAQMAAGTLEFDEQVAAQGSGRSNLVSLSATTAGSAVNT